MAQLKVALEGVCDRFESGSDTSLNALACPHPVAPSARPVSAGYRYRGGCFRESEGQDVRHVDDGVGALARWAHRRLQPPVLRSATRFAIAMLVADVIILRAFAGGEAVAMGSFAVIVLLYFLDYDGSARERLVGFATAIGIGMAVMTVGVLLSGRVWLAVAGAFVISGTFGYLRVLRGYVARAAVGLQCAFFLPLMTNTSVDDLPSLLAAWLTGGLVALIAGMLVLPKYRDGVLRSGLAAWLQAATALGSDVAAGRDLEPSRRALSQAAAPLLAALTGPRMRPGAIGHRQRALAEMIDVVHWSGPVLEQLTPLPIGAHRQLADESTAALAQAARVVAGQAPNGEVVDLPSARQADLLRLAGTDPSAARSHYSCRLLSILAMWMLWLAGRTRGLAYPTPDIGSMADERPLALLRAHARLDSPWLRNAVRTGACAAACVLIVRLMGLDHGVWVVLAALCVTQVSFSGMANGASAIRMVVGAAAGVLLASIGLILHFPQAVDLALLPVAAFLAVIGAAIGPFTAQLLFTPFVLLNFAAIEYATQRGLEVVRLEDVAIGATVAAAFAFMVFPFGLVAELQAKALAARKLAAAYLIEAVAAARGQDAGEVEGLRRDCVRALVQLEATLDAAHISGDVPAGDLQDAGRANAIARDRLVGADTCVQLGRDRAVHADLGPIADEFADWWDEHLLEQVGPVEG